MVNKHKISSVILLIIFGMFIVVFYVSALDSEDIDELCNEDFSTYYRNNGTWECIPYNLSHLNDVDTTGAVTNSVLKYNNGIWIVGTDQTGGGGSGQTFDQDLNTTSNVSFTGIDLNSNSYFYKNFTEYNIFGDPGGIRLIGTEAYSKPSIEFYSYDKATDKYGPVGWFVCHYNSTSGNTHSHCSIETLDNSTGTPSINSHLSITYNGSQERALVTFPGSDVQILSSRPLYFGDTFGQAWIVHNSTSGDLELKSNADIKIQASQIDLNQKDIVNIDDLFSTTFLDIKSGTDFRIFPDSQTSRTVSFSDTGSNIQISSNGATMIEFLEDINITNNDLSVDNRIYQGEYYTEDNGTCLNTYKNTLLIRSIGCS